MYHKNFYKLISKNRALLKLQKIQPITEKILFITVQINWCYTTKMT